MPSFMFAKKRRQSDGALKAPQPVSVEVEPLPRVPSKFRSMVTSGLFTRSSNDLRRAARLGSRSDLLQDTVHGRARSATTATTTIKLVSDDPTLSREVAEMPRDKSSMRRTSGESSTMSGHSLAMHESSKLASPKHLPAPDLASATADPTPAAISKGQPQRDLRIVTQHDERPAAGDGESVTSPVSTAFMTPPQRLSEEHHSAPVLFPSTIGEEPEPYDTSVPERIVGRRESTMSNLSEGGPRSPHRKLSLVLHSAPMPLPIANLPTLPTPSSPTAHAPWGDLAKNGGPKSPMASRNSTGTSFPWVTAPVAEHGEAAEDLSEADLQKVTKAMPVILRVPSRKPEPVEEGGDAGDETESEEAGPSRTTQISTPTPRSKGKGVDRRQQDNGEASSSADYSFTSSTGALGLDLDDRCTTPLPTSAVLALRQESLIGTPSTASIDIDDDSDNDSNAPSEQETAGTSITLGTPSTPTSALRPPLFSHASKSMIDLSSPIATSSRPNLEPVAENRNSGLFAPPSDLAPVSPLLKRRLSDGDLHPPPPKYEAVTAAFDHLGPVPKPREEEGREKLPPYWCGIHIEGTLSRKMEFTQPGLQAKDRSWKKYYLVLHGTALYVYKFDPTRVPLRAGEPYLPCDENEINRFLHVHPAPDRRFLVTGPPAPTPPRPSTPSRGPSAPSSRNPSGTLQATGRSRRNTISLEGALRSSPIGVITHRRTTVGSQTPTTREANSSGDPRDMKDPDLFTTKAARRQSLIAAPVASSTASAPLASHMPFAHNMLIHKYSLQGAESGLAADYKKRLHCVRIRAEGQQFMLQTETARQCVQWIEAFQAATNVALDLDVRPMPVQQTLPRRRRRAGARRPAAATTTTAAEATPTNIPPMSDADPAWADTPEGNAAAVEAAERAAREAAARERDRMLAEDQAANVGDFQV